MSKQEARTDEPGVGLPPQVMRLTERQREVMEDMEFSGNQWVRPMDVGAWDGSYHSAVLNQLVRKGLVERRHRGSDRSFRYNLTDKGRAIMADRQSA